MGVRTQKGNFFATCCMLIGHNDRFQQELTTNLHVVIQSDSGQRPAVMFIPVYHLGFPPLRSILEEHMYSPLQRWKFVIKFVWTFHLSKTRFVMTFSKFDLPSSLCNDWLNSEHKTINRVNASVTIAIGPLFRTQMLWQFVCKELRYFLFKVHELYKEKRRKEPRRALYSVHIYVEQWGTIQRFDQWSLSSTCTMLYENL